MICGVFVFSFCLYSFCFAFDFHPPPNFEAQCSLRCPLQNQTEEGHFDVGCGSECRIQQCMRGCELWQIALESSCQVVCNGTQELLPPKELYCVMGCNDAVNRYFQHLKDEIGTPPPPALVADTLTNTSLSLQWEGKRFANISYLVQWRYEEIADTWQYCRNQSWGPHSTILVENLQPYTKYRFRIALLLSRHHSDPIVSEPSLVIITESGGTPSSPPSIDIPASENKDFYMFQNLQPSHNYSVSIMMHNAAGLGPPATFVVTTPAYSQVKETTQLILLLGAHHTVISHSADILEDPVIMYKTTHLIRGVAVHVRKDLLFVSDSSGNVWVTSSYEYTPPTQLLTARPNLTPHDLTVDWLNDLLYILAEVPHSGNPLWQVVRCGLDGSGITVAVAGFVTKPLHIEVDPYNGYLFWVIQGQTGGGLYRLDLADISNGVKHEVQPKQILQSPHLGAFTVDHTNFRILVPNHEKNTVVAVSLDGHEVTDIRHNTQQPQFRDVLSLAMANGLFYWTNGTRVLTEEYHIGQDSYFHNLLYSDNNNPSYVSVSVNLPSSQPIPIPVNPPITLQAVLGYDIAKTSWTLPHLLGGQGKGAWQNWSYQLNIRNVNEEIPDIHYEINSTYFTVHNLQPNTEYIMKAAAYTSGGVGPWSTEFKGKTLHMTSEDQAPMILWSAAEGLLMSDVIGEKVTTLIHRENLQDLFGNFHITDISWYKDQLYLVNNMSNVYWYNITSHEQGRLRDIDAVGSIAVDWIGKKLYWSNPKQQLILRGTLNGLLHEPLPILTVAKELNVDAVQGFIYWSTGHAVECARLNGKQRRLYYPAELFSGKQVMGLTLDMLSRSVYWIVRSYEGSSLFRAVTAEELKMGEEIRFEKISSLQYPNMQGPLCYFDDHLVWLRDDHYAVIGDMRGQNSAVLSGMSLSELNMVAIMDNALHYLPDGIDLDTVNVIPEAVEQESLHIMGTLKDFNITWYPIENVNYGQVFYEIKIRHDHKKDLFLETTSTFWNYNTPNDLAPYSPLTVSIRAITYWGTSAMVRAVLYSPPSIPSPPVNPRVFMSYIRNPIKKDQDIVAVFRWNPPKTPNGIIIGYKVRCLLLDIGKNRTGRITVEGCDGEYNHIPVPHLEHTIHNIPKHSAIFFKVKACTEVDCGQRATEVYGNSEVETPVPQLLLSTRNTVEITDCDKNENRTLSRSGSVIDLSYSSHDGHVYWIDDNNHIVMSKLNNTSEKSHLLNLNNTGLCLAVDWVGRFLYWAEKSDQGSVIYTLDLNRGGKYHKRILSRKYTILKLQVSPLNSMLYWVEERSHNTFNIMKSSTDGSSMQRFFSSKHPSSRWSRQNCNCLEAAKVGMTIAIDQSEGQTPRLLYVDAQSNHIMAADMDACNCQMLTSNSSSSTAGLPPTSLTVGHRLIYWSNSSEGRIYSLVKNSENAMLSSEESSVLMNASGVQNIAALGSHLQPYPDARCLTPKPSFGVAELVNTTSQTITLQLPLPERDEDCTNVSLATVSSTVYYGIIDADGVSECVNKRSACFKLESFERIVTIIGLQAYTNYVFLVTLRNHYSELQGLEETVSPPSVYQTAPGAPSPPQNLSAIILNPTTVRVFWRPPLEMNAEHISYEVFWRKEGIVEGLRHQRGQLVKENHNESNSLKWVDLQRLSPSQEYLIWVRARSQKVADIYSDSKVISATTYPKPDNITLVQATSNSFNISWSRYVNLTYISMELQASISDYEAWEKVPIMDTNISHNYFFMSHLKAKTKYIFRLNILFTEEANPYIWPMDHRFVFETLGDRPNKPGIPSLQKLRKDVYKVVWEEPMDNGGKINQYWLEGKQGGDGQREKRETNTTVNSNQEYLDEWIVFYNGSENYWIMTELSIDMKYQFRVRAKNIYGWSDFSDPSNWFDLNKAAVFAEPGLSLVLWVFAPLAVLLVSLTMTAFMCTLRLKNEKDKKAAHIASMNLTIRSGNTDMELATLRELPRQGNFVHNSNALYSAADFIPTDAEIALLPRIRRDQITLMKFLGSGAFGEVFEGKAKNLPDSEDEDTRVAVKTLRKGASEQEKLEFLKEAQLMSNFKHEHILQLLGVCLDNDPNFIIMELMEGGDLLSYLRSSRPLITTASGLTLLDLLAMCVDVARGCRYLEEMHFVHRDLACRNCLVSSTDPCLRIVKIGDFGLARDIYKNDYYRKEGEGLLPVRWMAPESLVDGVFTCQSDVWSFGVLLWEIMSLGQQPYPARTNLEVLHYVRNGGRLGCPQNCSQEMYDLMIRCWSFSTEERPTFKYCLDVLEELKRLSPDTPLAGIHNAHLRGNTLKRDSKESKLNLNNNSSNQDSTDGIPKYLELLYDEDRDEGYEIPRPSKTATTSCESPSEQIPLVQSESSKDEVLSSTQTLLPLNMCNGFSYTNMNKNSLVLDKVALTSEIRNTPDINR